MLPHYLQPMETHDEPAYMAWEDGGAPESYMEVSPFSASPDMFAYEYPTMESFLYNTGDGSSFPFQHANLNTVAPLYHPAEVSTSPYFAFQHDAPDAEGVAHPMDDTASDGPASPIEFDDFIYQDVSNERTPTASDYVDISPLEHDTSGFNTTAPAIPTRSCGPDCNALCLVPYHHGGHSESHTLKLLYADHAHLIPHWPPPADTYHGFTPSPLHAFTDALLRSAPKGCLISDPVTLLQYRIAGKQPPMAPPSQTFWRGEVISAARERVMACDGYSDPLRWHDFGCRPGIKVDAEVRAKAKVRAQALLAVGGVLGLEAMRKGEEEERVRREQEEGGQGEGQAEAEQEQGQGRGERDGGDSSSSSSDGMEWDNWFGMPGRFKESWAAHSLSARSGV